LRAQHPHDPNAVVAHDDASPRAKHRHRNADDEDDDQCDEARQSVPLARYQARDERQTDDANEAHREPDDAAHLQRQHATRRWMGWMVHGSRREQPTCRKRIVAFRAVRGREW